MRKAFFIAAAFLLPIVASAHEVYVLTPEEIQTGLHMPSFSEWQVIFTNVHQFMFWAFIGFVLVSTVFFISISRTFEKWLDPQLAKLPKYAPTIARITIGLSLLAAAYYNALFGPELPLDAAFGGLHNAVRALLVVLGLMITCNIYVQIAAIATLALFCFETYLYHAYMLTYINYFGELSVLVLASAKGTGLRIKKYGFAWLRICFGVALMYASFYAKILHNNLALQVATLPLAGHTYGIAEYMGFEPHFLVLGAAIVEMIIGLFFIIGFEIRWTSIFLLFWLSLSLMYFGEVVWPHLILIGIPLAFICYGYDKYSLEGYMFKRADREPIL